MRLVTLTRLADLASLPFDQVIDARSPSEFDDDHIPGAINLPVLDDAERAQVGTVYVQDSKFRARRIGAALVARNAARHLETALADKPADFRPLVYCWRGGQRSGSFALILAQIGWQVGVIEGGWKAWRRLVQKALYDAPFPAPVVVLDGNTGTAKTEMLAKLAAQGVQVIDLESLARHRGSLFGLAPGDRQPTQKRFESGLAQAMAALDPARPVVVEAESNRIGALRLPPGLWRAMQGAPRIELSAPLAERARFLTRAYADITLDSAVLRDRIEALRPYQPRERIEEWLAMAQANAFEGLAESLMRDHYDPRYAKTKMRDGAAVQIIELDTLDETGQSAAAERIVGLLPSLELSQPV